MNLDDVVRAASLDDRTERVMLADALEEAGRGVEAALLREPGTVALMTAHEHLLRDEVMTWQRCAVEFGRCRCTLAEWLGYGPDVVRDNPGLRRVEITDKEPVWEADGDRVVWRWHAVADPSPYGLTVTVPSRSVIRTVMEAGPHGAMTYTYPRRDDAYGWLSARCLEWARREADLAALEETAAEMEGTA